MPSKRYFVTSLGHRQKMKKLWRCIESFYTIDGAKNPSAVIVSHANTRMAPEDQIDAQLIVRIVICNQSGHYNTSTLNRHLEGCVQ